MKLNLQFWLFLLAGSFVLVLLYGHELFEGPATILPVIHRPAPWFGFAQRSPMIPRKAPLPGSTELSSGALTCLAKAIYWESKDEPLQGRQLVAYVVMNRLRLGFEDTVCDVVYAKNQFNGPAEHINSPVRDAGGWKSSVWIAEHMLSASGPLTAPVRGFDGALYFMNEREARWAARQWFYKCLERLGTIGNHTFFGWSDTPQPGCHSPQQVALSRP